MSVDGTNAPADTLKYFKSIFENNNTYKVDLVELNIHITLDDKLVLLSSNTLDDVSDSKIVYGKRNLRPQDSTYEQLTRYNLGYNYIDASGRYLYREKTANLDEVKILSLEEVFSYLENQVKNTWKTELLYVINIKSSERNDKAIDVLYETLITSNILQKIILNTTSSKMANYIDGKYPNIKRTATNIENVGFYSNFIFGVNLSKNPPRYSALLIPNWAFVVNLGKKSIVDYAHKYGISVMYKTINNTNTIKHLSKIGADAILTTNLYEAYKVINN
jgi:glycerophosphoryl diester phosphodiesterase